MNKIEIHCHRSRYEFESAFVGCLIHTYKMKKEDAEEALFVLDTDKYWRMNFTPSSTAGIYMDIKNGDATC